MQNQLGYVENGRNWTCIKTYLNLTIEKWTQIKFI